VNAPLVSPLMNYMRSLINVFIQTISSCLFSFLKNVRQNLHRIMQGNTRMPRQSSQGCIYHLLYVVFWFCQMLQFLWKSKRFFALAFQLKFLATRDRKGGHVSKYLQPYVFVGMWIMCFGSHSSKLLGNLFKQNIQNLE
jgi:hypothetical protein